MTPASGPRLRCTPSAALRRLVGVVLVVSALLAGCGGVGSPSSHRTITVVTTADLGGLDTWAPLSGQQDLLRRNVFQTLLTVGPEGGEPQNDLAESCRFSATTAYTCRLKDAGFPDGTPVQPVDVAWTFADRHDDSSAASSDAVRLHSLIRSVETVDDHTFTLDLTRPDSELPYLLTLPAAAIVRSGSDPSTAAVDGAFGSGPYWVESENDGDVVLVANPHYSFAGTVGNDRVVIRRVPDAAAGTAAVAAGSADVFYPGDERESQALVAPAGESELTREASLSTTVLALNEALPGELERPARQALAALLDRTALARSARGSIVPLFSALPSNVEWSTGPAREDDGPDPARAAALLRGAGLTIPVPLRLARPPGLVEALWNELVRQVRAGGLFDPTVTDATGGPARVLTESPATSDPLAYLSLANAVDRSGVLADLITRARSDTDLASREKSVIDVQEQLADRSFAIPLWQGTTAVVTRSGVERVTVSPFLRLWLLRPPR